MNDAALSDLPVATNVHPMEAKSEAELPAGDGWQFEPKFDGFRCLAFRAGAEVALFAKSGKPLGRYFPEVVARLAALPRPRFVLDGELTIVGADFDALQMRLHPAESRIRRLAAETPATLNLFDMLVSASGDDLSGQPLDCRRAELAAFLAGLPDRSGLELAPARSGGWRGPAPGRGTAWSPSGATKATSSESEPW
jgi:ATP-dependent DNA ligase